MIFHEINVHPTPKPAVTPNHAAVELPKTTRRPAGPHETDPAEEVLVSEQQRLLEPTATAPVEDEQAISGLTKSSGSTARVIYDRASQKDAAMQKLQREREAAASTEPLPTAEEAIVRIAAAKNHVARMEARDSAPIAAEEVAAARIATEELAERGVLREAASELRASERAFAEHDEMLAYRNSISDLSESEAAAETSALDSEISKAVLAGDPKLVDELEAKKAAIQDAQIAIAQRKDAAEREAAYQKAQQQIAMQRLKDSEKAHKVNLQRELEQKVKTHAQHAQQAAATQEHRAAAQRALALQFERRMTSHHDVHQKLSHVDQDIASAKQQLHVERVEAGTVYHPEIHNKQSGEELLQLEQALAKKHALATL